MPSFVRGGVLVAFACVCALPSLASAHEYKAGDLVIQHPWTRATPPSATVAGGYMTIENHGATDDRLVGGSFEAAARFETHEMSTTDGVMRMRPVGPLTIPAGKAVPLAPEATHIMFSGLKHGLKQGESVPGTLVFERAGTVAVHFTVDGIGAKGTTSGAGMPGMKMP